MRIIKVLIYLKIKYCVFKKMDLLTDFAKNVFYNSLKLKNDPETNYNTMLTQFADFTKTYPLIVKYMCSYRLFNAELFTEMLQTQQKSRLKYEQNFELQANYVKKLLVINGVSKIEAKKVSNLELNSILTEIKNIQKTEKKIKRETEKIKSENLTEIRKETLDFILNINKN